MNQLHKWLTQPISPEDADIWYKANNIQPELTDLFRDFCFSLYNLITSTYLGDSHGESNETKIGMTEEEKLTHFKWCWTKTIENFGKENITFRFADTDFTYFQSFFFDIFYNQQDNGVRDGIKDFITQLFNRKRPVSKSDIEMFTDVYKILEKSLYL